MVCVSYNFKLLFALKNLASRRKTPTEPLPVGKPAGGTKKRLQLVFPPASALT